MLDFVTLVMFLVIMALGFSVYQVRCNRYGLHKRIQLGTALALFGALIAFEIDMRFITDWRALAEASPFYASGTVDWCLAIHLVFAIPTPVVWAVVIWMALRQFKDGFDASGDRKMHRLLGRIAALMMLMTAITGWVFYYVAFVAVN